MNKIASLLFVFLCSWIISPAQNVGIGTTTPHPNAILELNSINKGLLLPRGDADTRNPGLKDNTAKGLLLFDTLSGTLWLHNGNGTTFGWHEVQDDINGLWRRNGSDLVNSTTGNIGIGTTTPVYKVQINSPASTTNFLSMTNSTTGSTATDGLVLGLVGNSARMGNLEAGDLRLATSNATRLLIDASGNVGIGNTSPLFKLDVSGDANITGALRVDGLAGTAGQVLTSSGTGSPIWKNQAYTNNVRFGVQLDESLSGTSNTCRITETQYNLSPADVTIGATTITINKSGLYHFDMGLSTTVSYGTVPTVVYPRFGLWFFAGFANSFQLIRDRLMTAYSNTNLSWMGDGSGSIDVYITAPANISVYHTIGGLISPSATNFSASGYLTGYLISE